MHKKAIQKLLRDNGISILFSGKTRTMYVSDKKKSELLIAQKIGFLPDYQIKEVESE